MRCADGRNHELVIVSLICEEAKRQHKQYTKRMLPWFVIPECNIRLDLVLNLLKLVELRWSRKNGQDVKVYTRP